MPRTIYFEDLASAGVHFGISTDVPGTLEIIPCQYLISDEEEAAERTVPKSKKKTKKTKIAKALKRRATDVTGRDNSSAERPYKKLKRKEGADGTTIAVKIDNVNPCYNWDNAAILFQENLDELCSESHNRTTNVAEAGLRLSEPQHHSESPRSRASMTNGKASSRHVNSTAGAGPAPKSHVSSSVTPAPRRPQTSNTRNPSHSGSKENPKGKSKATSHVSGASSAAAATSRNSISADEVDWSKPILPPDSYFEEIGLGPTSDAHERDFWRHTPELTLDEPIAEPLRSAGVKIRDFGMEEAKSKARGGKRGQEDEGAGQEEKRRRVEENPFAKRGLQRNGTFIWT